MTARIGAHATALVALLIGASGAAAAAPPGRIAYTAVSPDSSDWQVRVVNADGTGARTVYTCPTSSCELRMSYQAWDPAGRRVAVVEWTRVPCPFPPDPPHPEQFGCLSTPVLWRLIDVDRGSVQTLSPPPIFTKNVGEAPWVGLPFWSPDGNSFASTGTHEDPQAVLGYVPDAYVVGSDGTGQKAIYPNVFAWVSGWTLNAQAIVFDGSLGLRKIDPATGAVSPFPGLIGVNTVTTNPSPDGRFVAIDGLGVLDNSNLAISYLNGLFPASFTVGSSWSPDSAELAYIQGLQAVINGSTSLPGPTPLLARAPTPRSAVRTVIGGERIVGWVSWSPPRDPTVSIDTPVAGQEITGHESTAAAQDAVRLKGSVSSRTALSGWCFAVQAPSAAEPSTPSKADCNRPFALTLASGGRTTGEFEADIAVLVGRELKPGENTVWVWGYDAGPGPGVAKVTVKVKANYYIRHIELAQSISPDLEPALPFDPLLFDPYTFHWSVPSVGGFNIPLVAGKRTLLRIYVGDSSLPAGGSGSTSVAYRVTGTGLATPREGSQVVGTTTRGTPLDQSRSAGSINVWLSAGAARAGPASFHVEINPDEQEKECLGCFPNGNRADLVDVRFDKGGSVELLPVDIVFDLLDKRVRPSSLYADIVTGMVPLLPIADFALSASIPQPHRAITIDPRALIAIPQALQGTGFPWACAVVLARLELFGLMQPTPAGAGVTRWVGLATAPEGFAFPCGGISELDGKSFALFHPDSGTAVHELGHSLGLPHTLGFDLVPGGAVALPYFGIGGVGYNANSPQAIFDKRSYGDIMSYSTNSWTSPKSWQVMFDEILARSGGPAASTARRAAAGAAAVEAAPKRSMHRRRLVSGVVVGGKAVLMGSVVADALAPDATGPVVARLVGLDRRGHKVASAPIHGTPGAPRDEARPFLAALPANRRIASLEVQPPRGGKSLARLSASRHPPKARFVRLRKRSSADKALTVRWAASDRDRRDRLSVILLARRGRRPWQTITMGPARLGTTVDPRALGAGKRLSVRLLVSDGFATSVVNARPIKLAGR